MASFRARRGFAMPMAIMVVLVLTTMLSMMLERHIGQILSNRRQLDAYAFGQATRGISEALDAWIRSNGNNPIAGALDSEGLAFTLSTDGGQVVKVYLRDGQGQALADLAGLGGDTLQLGYDVVDHLVQEERENARKLVRREGPLAISVNSAPKAVLKAAIEAADVEGVAGGLLGTLLSMRSSQGGLTPEELTQVIQDEVEDGASRVQISALLTANPALWRVEITSEARVTGQVDSRYRAWSLITRTAAPGQGDRASSIERPTSIFGWERVVER